ncbi:MAG TPA: hypothetical protein VFY39_00990 [Gammaproteobacteria bacterium]|nr:hypothetical protein [Gammaproteobacteria bacterium]
MPENTAEHEFIRGQVAKIAGSGALGRSRSYVKLLEFLVACTFEGRTPKEHEIATEVFKRGADFDPSQDAMVRVYAHHLRQKLENYYAEEGRDEPRRIVLPKGEYRIAVAPLEPEPAEEAERAAAPKSRRGLQIASAAAVLVLLGVLVGAGMMFALRPPVEEPATPYDAVASAPIWRSLLDDQLPILVVVGDYYIFGELDSHGNVTRMIRNFSINSPGDLDQYVMQQPELAKRYVDLNLTYLPLGTAFALRDLLRVLYTSNKPVRVVSMSELKAEGLRNNHIVYVGYISGLDKLFDFVFASSGLAIGETYDQIIDLASGKVYTSEGGIPPSDRNYRDYGLFSTFAGPGGNQFMVVAGTRDAGLMQTAYAVTDAEHLEAINAALPKEAKASDPSFEVLYEVTGFDRTNLDSVIVHAAHLAPRHSWDPALTMPPGPSADDEDGLPKENAAPPISPPAGARPQTPTTSQTNPPKSQPAAGKWTSANIHRTPPPP